MKKSLKSFVVIMCICAIVSSIGIGLSACNKGEKDILVISREDGSGTRDAFDGLIKKDGASLAKDANGKKYTSSPFVKTVEMLSKTGDVKTKVSSTKTAIGYISLGSLDSTVKALTINGVVASSANVLDGSYSLKRPFVVVYSNKTALNAAAADFVKYLESKEAQAIVVAEKYVEQASTKSYTAPADVVSGTVVIKGSTSVDPLMDKLIAGYKKAGGNKISEVVFEKDAQGSSHGVTAAKTDTVGNVIGMSSSAIKEADASSLNQFNIALDAVAVIVNNNNPIENVTVEQLFDIYTGKIKKFSEIK